MSAGADGAYAQDIRPSRARCARFSGTLLLVFFSMSSFATAAAAQTAIARAPEVAAETASAPAIDLDGVELSGVTRAPAGAAPHDDADTGGGEQGVEASEGWRVEGLALLSIADGIGGGAQLRNGPFGLRATVGFDTLLVIADDDPGDTNIGSFEIATGLQLSADALVVFGEAERGVSLGYRYNSVLGHGAAVGYQSTLDVFGQRFVFTLPFIYFPRGTERVREELGLSSRHRINHPFGAGFQYGMGIAWRF